MDKIKLHPDTAAAIVEYRYRHPIKDLTALKIDLSKIQFSDVSSKLKILKAEDSTLLAKEYGIEKITPTAAKQN
jgi:hypothetical protein